MSFGITAADYEEALRSHREHARRLDVIWNGEEGAAKRPALIDVIAQIANELPALRAENEALKQALSAERDEVELKQACIAGMGDAADRMNAENEALRKAAQSAYYAIAFGNGRKIDWSTIADELYAAIKGTK